MENYSNRLMLGCSATALLLSLGTAAYAQNNEETVVVSSTRLQNAGFDAPTPTTVVGIADIEKNAQPSVFEAMTQLPALQGSTGVSHNTGSTTTGLMGLSSFNLRALGVLRTLVLLDNQRIVSANPNGAVDVSQIPQALIQRVDIVTGGASASWGSDAIAGVVNFVTDKRFEGFKANIMAGQSTYGDDQNATLQFAAGTSFLGGKAHIEIAGEYSYTAGVYPGQPISSQFGSSIQPGGRNYFSNFGTDNYGTPTAAIFTGGCGATKTCVAQNFYGPLAQNTINYPYGMIINGPLQGTMFGANGQAAAFDYAGGCTPSKGGTGSSAGAVIGAIGNTCFGTVADPGDQTARQWTHTLVDPLTRGNVYTRLSYEIAPGTEIYGTVNMSTVRTQAIPAQGNSNRNGIIVKCDNAYLPASGAFGIGLNYAQTIAACNALYGGATGVGVTATQIANYNLNQINTITTYNTASQLRANTATGAPVGGFDISTTNGNIPLDQIVNLTRNQRRYVVGAEGGFTLFGTDYSWDTYYERGEGSVSVRMFNMPLKTRFNFAIDAIQDPVTGQIVCRDVAARNNGCVPYNPFTTSIPNPGSIAYFDNQQNGTRLGGPLMRQSMTQDAFSLNFAGSPLELWAGKVAVAAGFDYRQEKFWQQADPYAGGITASTPANSVQPCVDPSIECRASGVYGGAAVLNPGNWNAGNYTSGFGNYHVWEIYTEVGVPIFNTPEFGKLDASLAGRFERYSTAGDFTTWKVGMTWETPLPGIKLRALQSRDTRAPNLSDLYLPPQTLNGSFVNRFFAQNSPAQQIGQTNAGNPLLQPERGQTTEMGLVWQPDFLPGFQTSFDYYRIAVKGIISSSGVQTVQDLCFQGFSQYCSQAFIPTKNGQPQTTNPGSQGIKGDANEVLAIVAVPFNTAGLLTDGFDIESSYQFDIEDWGVPGEFLLRSLVNHTSKFLRDPGVPGQFTDERAGVLGGGFNSDTYSANTGNVLNWKITLQQNWTGEIWGFNLTERWYSGGVMRGRWTTADNPLGLANGTPGLHYLTCAPGSCPAPTLQMPTTNYQRVPSILYLDVGGSYNWNEKTQLYFKIDNIANVDPPNTGGGEVNNTLYDVIGRMYRIGVRINN